MVGLVAPAEIRARFAAALSDMYRAEVPQYGALLALVDEVNRETLAADPILRESLSASGELQRIGAERHGAIRLGTADELAAIARAFRVMGMKPVSYYDLATAGVPVHSTAFRPVTPKELAASPFRVFTSLLRLELIEDPALRAEAAEILDRRQIVNEDALALIAAAEAANGLTEHEVQHFLRALLETFRWHQRATIEGPIYERLLASHRLVADVVSFPGPHINHLTPRTLDIDTAHARMIALGFGPKEEIEGPPRRNCPILLRQTSFKALNEAVRFPDGSIGNHTARFGEIEQRGIALTKAGRAIYDRQLGEGEVPTLPDDPDELCREGLAFFRYHAVEPCRIATPSRPLDTLIAEGAVRAIPITYEDFLPVNAAGIFRSNLGSEIHAGYEAVGKREEFERTLGEAVLDEFALYGAEQAHSLRAVERTFGWGEGSITA